MKKMQRNSHNISQKENLVSNQDLALSKGTKSDLTKTIQLTFLLFLLAIFSYYAMLGDVSMTSLTKMFAK